MDAPAVYGAFALGFVLWGAGVALGSGALEALVYDELDRAGAAGLYARVMGRAPGDRHLRDHVRHGPGRSGVRLGRLRRGGRGGCCSPASTAAAVATRFPEHRTPSGDGERWSATCAPDSPTPAPTGPCAARCSSYRP
ncbi:MFS transporter [Streptomyces violaceorubidus]